MEELKNENFGNIWSEQIFFTLDWRARLQSTISLSAPPMPKSGWRNTTLTILTTSSTLKEATCSRGFRLELDHLALPLLLSTELEVLGPLDGNLVLPLADRALHPEHQLLRGLRLLPQDRLRLASKALLFAVVPVTQRCKVTHQATKVGFFNRIQSAP